MAPKKDTKAPKSSVKGDAQDMESFGKIGSASDLKKFLESVLDRVKDDSAPAIYVVGAMNHVLKLAEAYEYLNNENRELARDIWLRLKQTGIQIKNPPMLFSEGDVGAEGV